ncbi:hypothetical protein J4414_03665 [Candidatus Woesearchaeota archaeon]|nr:hypothetical protein [Candidatus Woesearchaeota archaeon]
MNQEMQEQLKLQEQLAQLESSAKQYMTKEAIQRYGNLKVAHPQKALEVIMLLAQLIQNGQLKDKVDDYALKEFLLKTQQQKREFKLMRK